MASLTPKIAAACGLAAAVVAASTVMPRAQDAAPKPTLYVTATAHLDSQWNWTVQDTIRQYVPSTFYANFDYLDKYPDYTFTYEGAIHYMWFKEYHPDDWARLQAYVAKGRWRLAGSWIDAVDTNIPSPESLMRQALYGEHFFRREFGTVSRDVYLPDCFGFGFALPSIAAHSGLSTFTTQKLTWGLSVPIPFPIGRWKGVDGSEVIANLNPGAYDTKLTSDISSDPKWSNDLTTVPGGRIGFRLFGTGDIGGGPDPASMDWLQKAMTNSAGLVTVRNVSPDQATAALTPAQRSALPVYEGELTMQTHGVGCYTSQAAMKKFNRQNELLADSAERAGVAAGYLAGLPYPTERLRNAWTRVLWHQFHDDLTGTCIPQAYQFSWNDELSAANQFAGVLTSSTAAVSAMLNTTTAAASVPLVVYNPTGEGRRGLVDATVTLPEDAGGQIQVHEPGKPAEIADVVSREGRQAHVMFEADVPAVGYKVFEVGVSDSILDGTKPAVTKSTLQDDRYTVKIDANGDIGSIVDREAGRELLKSPIRLELRDDPSPDKPAWRILYSTITAPVREYPSTPTVAVEMNRWRPALVITRHVAGSTIVQRVSLPRDQGRVDVETDIDWKSPNTLLKAVFPLAASNPVATYDLGLGTIQRGTNTEKAYEVPAQRWADITDASGTFGTAILNDSKYGWDKPSDNTLRLTLLHTPQPRAYPYQGSNDLGHHHFVYSIAGHRGDWRAGRVPSKAEALNQPFVAFQTDRHNGPLGRTFSMATVGDTTGQFAVRALKRAEDSDEIVVRLQELYGRAGRTRLAMSDAITSARELNAIEEPLGPLTIEAGSLMLDFRPYQPRTVAVRVRPRPLAPAAPTSTSPLPLPFNLDGVSTDRHPADGDFDGRGHTLSGDLLPQSLTVDGIPFAFGSSTDGALNVLVPKGQTIDIPSGRHGQLYLVAAAVGGSSAATVVVDERQVPITVHEWEGAIGQWDSRLAGPSALREPFVPSRSNGTPTTTEVAAGMMIPWDPSTFAIRPADIDRIARGFVSRDEIAWIGTHRHSPQGNQPYVMSYLFLYSVPLPEDARRLQFPDNPRIRILAATMATGVPVVRPTAPLYSADLPEPASPRTGNSAGGAALPAKVQRFR